MQLHPGACFFTDHYRDYPAVLIRLAEIPRDVLADILQAAWEDLSATRTVPARRPPKRRGPRTSRPGKR
jgi:hypothetical protein